MPLSAQGQLCPQCLLRLGLEETTEIFSVGERIDHYQILDTLGVGGMGRVYVAQDLKLKRQVALKVLSEAITEDPASLTRFRREAQSLAALHHPNVVTVYAVEESGGLHYIVMELVEGMTLRAMITPEGLDQERFLDLACDLSAGVAAAHERGIIHRDLKPTNVMLDRDGQVKVLDFGLAKAWSSSADQISTGAATEEGLVVGTVPYMSPEQLQGTDLDARSDVFSLGIVLYEMATGKHPFECETTAETISAILRDEPAPLLEIHRDLPVALQTIVERCLEKEPEDRYASAVELETDLTRLREVRSQDTDTWGAPAWTRLLDWNHIWPLAVAALFIGLIAAVVLQPFSGRRDPESVVEESLDVPVSEPVLDPEAVASEESPAAVPETTTEAGPEADDPPALDAESSRRPAEERVVQSSSVQYSVQASLFLRAQQGSRRLASGSRVAPGDELFLTIESSEDLYVYILNEDDLGEVFVLFPVSGVDLENPLPGGLRHRLPGDHEGTPLNWQVSSAGGEEHLLIVAGAEPVPELERLFAGLPQASPGRVEYLTVPDSVVAELRGIGRLVETESADAPLPGGRLFAEAQSVSEGPETAQGIWIRRIDLRNPL